MTITVAQAYIDTGHKCSSGYCPIALGLAEAFPRAKSIAVDLASASVTVTGQQLIGALPVEAQKFIVAFDSGSPVKPFLFDFLPEAVDRPTV